MKFFFRILVFFSFFMTVSCLSSPDIKYKNVSQMRDKIIKYDLKKYAQEDFNVIEKDFAEIKELLDKKRNIQADKLLDAINGKYQALIDMTFPLYTADKDKEVKIIQTDCLELKSDVAVKDKYKEAVNVYDEALKYNEAKEYEKAVELFDRSVSLFTGVEEITIEKKEKAETSFDETEEELIKLESLLKKVEEEISQIEKEKKEDIKSEGIIK